MARTVPDQPDSGWLRRWVARAGLVAVAAAAFRSSYDALVVVGTRAHMGDPRMLPLCLDGLAISTAAAIEGGRRRDLWPWFVLVAADVISTSLQVAAAPDDWSSQVVAAIPTPAALAAFHVIVWAVVEGQQGGVAPAAETDAVESGRRESNPRPPGPKPGALPTAPLPDDVRPLGALDHGRGVAGTSDDGSTGPGPDRATFADAKRIAAGRQLSGRALERAIQDEGLAVARRRATEWAAELARTAPDAPAGAPDELGESRHLEVVAR